MSQAWLASLADCIGLMLPPGLEQRADRLYTFQGRLPDDLSPTQKRILKLLSERGPLRGQQLEAALPSGELAPRHPAARAPRGGEKRAHPPARPRQAQAGAHRPSRGLDCSRRRLPWMSLAEPGPPPSCAARLSCAS